MCAHVVARAVLLATVPVALLVASPAAAQEPVDDDSDDAPYMMVLEHADGWQCAASLVSVRTGLTTARCARGAGGGGAPRELWALAAALLAARPPASPAAAARRVTRLAVAGDGRDPADPALDIAVVDLEAPFAMEARTRPIFMATRGSCDDSKECYSIRALSTFMSKSGVRRARFRVVNLVLQPERHCAAAVPHWSASHARSLCFSGDALCERDMGGGVVCGGKLCAVLSVAAVDEAGAQCGRTYAAQNITRWRSFLHCAHTLRLCGRGTSRCSEECSEIILGEKEDSTAAHTNATPSFESPSHTRTPVASTQPLQASRAPALVPAVRVPDDYHAPHASIEFEPNRADFKAAPSRTPRPGLKAGEYGDNAAEYGADELPASRAGPAPTLSASSPRPSRTPPAPPPTPTSALQVPPAPALQVSTSACSTLGVVSLLRLFICSIFCMVYLNLYNKRD